MTTGKQTLLCIDDEPSILTMRKIVLETMGYSVLTAENGPKGLDLLKQKRPELILLDYIMPRMDGGEVAQAVRKSGDKTPIIMVSALPDIPDNARDHVDAYVPKGESPSILLNLIANMLKARSHLTPEMTGEYVVFVDAEGKYVEATNDACGLLGYTRAEFIGKRIEEVSAIDPQKVADLFSEFQTAGSLQGEYLLLHRNGSKVKIRYDAKVYPDGCMAASWRPLSAADRTG